MQKLNAKSWYKKLYKKLCSEANESHIIDKSRDHDITATDDAIKIYNNLKALNKQKIINVNIYSLKQYLKLAILIL